MRYFEMAEPSNEPVGYDIPVFNVLSEDEIVSLYGDYYCLMSLTKLGYIPTREQIIEEWCIIHWSSELK